MPEIIDSAEPLGPRDSRNILVYGETGMRKTTSLKTLPEESWPILVLDIDRKTHMLREHFPPGKLLIAHFDRFRTTASGKRVPTLFKDIRDFLSSISKHIPEESFPKTIVIDSATLLYDSCLTHVMFKSNKDEEDPPQGDQYMIAKNLWTDFITKCLESALNIILICHERGYEPELSHQTKGVPALTGQLGLVTPRYFQEILHATTQRQGGSLEYVWELVPIREFIASSTMSHLGDVVPQDFSIFWPSTSASEQETTNV